MSEGQQGRTARYGMLAVRIVWFLVAATIGIYILVGQLSGEMSVIVGMGLFASVMASGLALVGLEYGVENYVIAQEGLSE